MEKDVLSEYPKKFTLNDGAEIIVRKVQKNDFEKLMKYYSDIPKHDRVFLKSDVTDEEIVRRWMKKIDYKKSGYALVAEYAKEKRIVGAADLHLSPYHWMQDNGEIRILIAGDFQRRGLGTLLAHEIFYLAIRINLYKAEVLLMSIQTAAIDLFKKLGFKREAVLKNHVIDLTGKRHDLVILTNNFEALWEKMEDLFAEQSYSKEYQHME